MLLQRKEEGECENVARKEKKKKRK